MDYIKKYYKAIIIGIVLLCVIVGGAFGYKKYFPEGIISALIEERISELKNQYEEELANKDREISIKISQLKRSENQVVALNKKIKDLEGQLINVEKPKTMSETRERFRALGYPPIQ